MGTQAWGGWRWRQRRVESEEEGARPFHTRGKGLLTLLQSAQWPAFLAVTTPAGWLPCTPTNSPASGVCLHSCEHWVLLPTSQKASSLGGAGKVGAWLKFLSFFSEGAFYELGTGAGRLASAWKSA